MIQIVKRHGNLPLCLAADGMTGESRQKWHGSAQVQTQKVAASVLTADGMTGESRQKSHGNALGAPLSLAS